MSSRNTDPKGSGPSQIPIDFSQEKEKGAEDSRSPWPPQGRFPLNEGIQEIGETIAESYGASDSFTIITAFTSLEHLLAFFSRNEVEGREVDIVLGSEPTGGESTLYDSTRPVEERAREYWLEKGISILTGGGAVRLIEAMEAGQVRFLAAEDLHAKIYVGDDAAVLGSSNFSRQGLHHQREANTRFERGAKRYEELSGIAAQYKNEARECTSEIRSLFEDLLRPVQWEEALAPGRPPRYWRGTGSNGIPRLSAFCRSKTSGLTRSKRLHRACGFWIRAGASSLPTPPVLEKHALVRTCSTAC